MDPLNNWCPWFGTPNSGDSGGDTTDNVGGWDAAEDRHAVGFESLLLPHAEALEQQQGMV